MAKVNEPLECHEFCDTLRLQGCDSGGSAFRTWSALFFHKGIFIGFKNHNWGVWFLSDPNTKWFRGCQESCSRGDPMSQPKEGKLLAVCQAPDEIKPRLMELEREAIEMMRKKIEAHKKKKEAEREAFREKQRNARDSIIGAWSDAN